MDRLDAMAVLLAVVEAGSLSAAARRLRAPLATVSRKVADLEAHLHTRLVVRTSRRVELTDAGRAYVAAARRILEQVEEAETAAAGEYREPRGELFITLPVSFGEELVLPIVLEFLRAHPAIDMRIFFSDGTVNLVDEHMHASVRIGDLDDPTLTASRVGKIRSVTCASPAFLAAHGTPRAPEELPGYAGITFKGFSSFAWRYQRDGKEVVAEPRSRVAVNSAGAAIAAAVGGLGITRALSFQVRAQLQSGALVAILEEFARPPVPISLVYPNPGLLPVKVRAFRDFVTPRMRAKLA